jgi:hypothetical protein
MLNTLTSDRDDPPEPQIVLPAPEPDTVADQENVEAVSG